MVYCHNCTSNINTWIKFFDELAKSIDVILKTEELFGLLFKKALEKKPGCGGLLAYNYYSGGHITGFE